MLVSKVFIIVGILGYMYLDDKYVKCLKNSIFSFKDFLGFVVKVK